MKEETRKIETCIHELSSVFSNCSVKDITKRPHENKWSKLEILGHLVDSALYNIQRFNEVQFSPQPFPVTSYAQDELVLTNQYQNEDPKVLFQLWKVLNEKIIRMVLNYNPETLALKFDLGNQTIVTLQFMITDYVVHLEHHKKQIL